MSENSGGGGETNWHLKVACLAKSQKYSIYYYIRQFVTKAANSETSNLSVDRLIVMAAKTSSKELRVSSDRKYF